MIDRVFSDKITSLRPHAPEHALKVESNHYLGSRGKLLSYSYSSRCTSARKCLYGVCVTSVEALTKQKVVFCGSSTPKCPTHYSPTRSLNQEISETNERTRVQSGRRPSPPTQAEAEHKPRLVQNCKQSTKLQSVGRYIKSGDHHASTPEVRCSRNNPR